MRIAVIDRDLCNSDKCQRECFRFCPGVRMGEKTVYFEDDEPYVNELLCSGCGICVKKCPFKAIKIINLPEALSTELIHQYGVNGFRLFRLPIIKPGKVVGIVGRNGIGKTTAINILSGKLVPNFGVEGGGSKERVLEYFRGTQMHDYFRKLYGGKLRVSLKPQPIYLIPKVVRGRVYELLKKVDENGLLDGVSEELGLKKALRKDIKEVSGGELQRIAIAAASLRNADVYVFDEPSSYNDVYERISVAKFIRRLVESNKSKSVIVVDHDLAFLDYVSDEIVIVYGDPGAFGVFSRPETVRNGINIFLDGYIPSDNIRFRDRRIFFEKTSSLKAVSGDIPMVEYADLTKSWNGFKLRVKAGRISRGEVIGVLGPNATGKTTFVRIIAGELKPDEGEFLIQVEGLSYKPQYLSIDFEGTVREYFLREVGEEAFSEFNQKSLLEPLGIFKLLDRSVKSLSGGELQKLFISTCLMKDAEIYLLDEPSAFIDVEDRLTIADAISRYIKLRGKSGLVVDHDLILVDNVSDRIIVFEGKPGISGEATEPMDKRSGFNRFLRDVGITIRRDMHSGRPRINKEGSRLDRLQKEAGEYFYEAK